MPRVVPSDVVSAIERMFPWVILDDERARNRSIGMGHSERLAAVVTLVEQLPEELIVLNAEDHLGLLCATSAARHQLALWESGVAEGYVLAELHGFEPRTPVVIVRDCLAKCPDQAPAPGTAGLPFITDAELGESIRLDISGANRDLAQGEWKGATVLAGSAIEALLLWALQEYVKRNPGTLIAATAALLGGNLNRQPDPDPERWDLHEYIEVAAHLRIIESDTATQARQAKGFRNLIHPGRARRLGQKCDRATALAALAAVEFVVRDLTP
jgi:hypothetical protein